MRRLFIIWLLLSPIFVLSQQRNFIGKENADCEHAVELTDTIFGPTNAPEGFGKTVEITGAEKSLFSFETEHNTVWYRFAVPLNSLLTLDIIPVDAKDDYDFILYKYTDENFCTHVKEKHVQPLRTNISRNNPGIESKTGLSVKADAEFIHAGPEESYSKALKVKKGEVYYLVLDNVYENGKGHTIKLHYNYNDKADEKNDVLPSVKINKTTINVNVTDRNTNKLLNSSITIVDADSPRVQQTDLCFRNTSSCFVNLEFSRTYHLQVNAKGYFNFTKEIKTKDNPENIFIRAELEKIEVGKNIIIDNILFYGNIAKFLPESYVPLGNLERFLKENETIRIEIQGHVNGPYNDTDRKPGMPYDMQLSVDRAEAVYDYLVAKGIAPNRLIYKGYDNTRMLYPYAVSEYEQQKNRRVEIVILSY